MSSSMLIKDLKKNNKKVAQNDNYKQPASCNKKCCP